jgi:hypothetical protein
MREKKETLRLLKGHTCVNCKYSWKSTTDLYVDETNHFRRILNDRICDYDNIVIHRPQGKEFPMIKSVHDLDYCPLFDQGESLDTIDFFIPTRKT